jgi:hypothetical protein
MKISRQDIRQMVTEAARTILREISVKDAYTRFYTGKVPEDVFAALMKGTDLMTPYHKIMLDAYIKKMLDGEDLQDAGNLWANSGNEARQYLVNAVKDEKDYLLSSEWNLKRLIVRTGKMKSHTENSFGQRGLEVLYEDSNVIITCTKSYTSSHQTYGDSHWCTASDIFGNYNGFEMFCRYTIEEGRDILVQFIDKTNKEGNSFQVQYETGDVYDSEICNWADNSVEIGSVIDMLRSHGVDYQTFINDVLKPNFDRLYNETEENIQDEADYYERKQRIRERKVFKKIDQNFNSEDFRKKIMDVIKVLISGNRPGGVVLGDGGRTAARVWDERTLRPSTETRGASNYVSIFGVSYYGNDSDESSVIHTWSERDDCWDDYDDFCLRVSQTWIINKSDLSVIGIYRGEYSGIMDNIIKLKTESQWGHIVSLVNVANGQIVYDRRPVDISHNFTRHIVYIWPTRDESDIIAVNAITGQVIKQ